jgi:hypothetical protein
MDLLWQVIGVVVLGGFGWTGFKSWQRGREIEALKREEASRKLKEAAMVSDAVHRLHVVRAAPDKPVDAEKRDAFL